MENKTLGQVAYEAYAAKADWKAYDGTKLQEWAELGTPRHESWEAAADAVVGAMPADAQEAA